MGRSYDAAMQTIRPQPVDAVTVTTVIDNSADLLAPAADKAREVTLSGPRRPSPVMEEGLACDALVGEHGFSALLQIRRGERVSSVLYDAGLTPFGVRDNLRRLQVDLRGIEALVMSHGHFDHTTGLEGVLGDLGRSGTPMVLHPDFWNRRRLKLEGTEAVEVPTPSRSWVRGTGVELIEEGAPSLLFDSGLLITGEVERTTGYEPGMPNQEAWRDGRWRDDHLVRDDQAAVINVAGKGLVVITGCGHAGIVNILRHVRKLTGIDRIYAVVGGFHLTGKVYTPIIDRVVEAIADMEPASIVPAHCTGWKAQLALAQRMPEAFTPNAVGASFEL